MNNCIPGLPDPRWAALAVIFNLQPASYLHDSWFEHLEHGQLLSVLADDARTRPRVSEYLLRHFGLETRYCVDFSTTWARIGLFDGAALEALFLYSGVVLRSQWIRQSILGEQWRALKEAVGTSGLAYALQRAPLIGSIPACPDMSENGDLREQLIATGAWYCLARMEQLGEAFTLRVALKLDRAWHDPITRLMAVSRGDGDASTRFILKIIQDRLPAWSTLFA